MELRVRIARRLKAPTRGVLVSMLALVLAGPMAADATAASEPVFSPDRAAAELVRLLNGERSVHGLPVLAVDPFLAAKARDGTVSCPDGAGDMEGRSKDMALSGYFSHSLRLCPTFDISDAMYAWGYHDRIGEIVAWNGYDYAPFPYQFGCDVRQAVCTGATTLTPTTVGIAAGGFMSSQGHRDNVLSPMYDRFACGAWGATNDQRYYYTCIFSFGPGTQPDPPPVPDTTAPWMIGVASPALVKTTNSAFGVIWGATDDRAVTRYRIRMRKDSGRWSHWVGLATTSKTFGGRNPGTWRVAVEARDAAGNWSAPTEVAVTIPTDDRAWAFSSGNTRRTGSNFIKGTDTTTDRAGATMTIRFTGSSFVLIGTTAANRGEMRVTVDGVAYMIDEGYHDGSRATSTRYGVVLLEKSLTNTTHTVVIACLGTSGRPTIDIDAAAWRN